jgi:hypothetical protein
MTDEALQAIKKGDSFFYRGSRTIDLLGYAYGVAGQGMLVKNSG